jgi:SAM-dependent methyltransferase
MIHGNRANRGNRGYRLTSCLWGTDPDPVLATVTDLDGLDGLDGLDTLDAACGEGRNAAYLAARGARVRAVDVSAAALANGRAAWPDAAIRWEEGDVLTVDLPAAGYGLVVIDSLLHWLDDEAEARAAIGRLQRATRPGGIHFVSSFNTRRQDFEAHRDPPTCLLDHATLLDLYADWTILVERDEDIRSEHADVPVPHTHSITKFLAERPAGSAWPR